jgi:3-oxoacyl-[acyl-carrier-protein] synthase-3
VNAACAGFSYGLSTGVAFIESGAETVVVMARCSRVELHGPDDVRVVRRRRGRGRAAPLGQPGVIGSVLGADGTAAEILIIPGGGSARPPSAESVAAGEHTIHMPAGREVFKRAVVEMANACRQLLEKSGLTPNDVDVLIPHQANARIMVAVSERLGIGLDRAVVDVAEVGNTSAASIPIALDRAWRSGRIHEGDLVLLTSFGAGLAWGANLVRWNPPAS